MTIKTKEELVDAVIRINESLEELKKIYEPYVGLEYDSLTAREQYQVSRIMELVLQLTLAKSDLRKRAQKEFKIIIF